MIDVRDFSIAAAVNVLESICLVGLADCILNRRWKYRTWFPVAVMLSYVFIRKLLEITIADPDVYSIVNQWVVVLQRGPNVVVGQ